MTKKEFEIVPTNNQAVLKARKLCQFILPIVTRERPDIDFYKINRLNPGEMLSGKEIHYTECAIKCLVRILNETDYCIFSRPYLLCPHLYDNRIPIPSQKQQDKIRELGKKFRADNQTT